MPFIRWDGVDRFLERLDEVEINLGMLFIELPLADLISLFEIFAAVGFLFQLVISGLLLRLSWEMRWYMVSNESLRIREGLGFVREQTMTVANIQNMSVRQGPIQKLFGIADLEVRTAGGGSSAESGESSGRSSNDFHIGRFRGLSDAHGLRDRLRATLAKHRDSGLGDPDEPTELLMPLEAGVGQSPGRLEAAAASLLDEARALRHVVEVSGS